MNRLFTYRRYFWDWVYFLIQFGLYVYLLSWIIIIFGGYLP